MKTFRTYVKEYRYTKEEVAGNNTTSVPGAGTDNTLHMKKMRTWKSIWRRHALPGSKGK